MPLVNGRTQYSKSISSLLRYNTSFKENYIELPELSTIQKIIYRIGCLLFFIPSLWIESLLLRKQLLELLKKNSAEAIVLDHFQFWWLALSVKKKSPKQKIILVSHNLEFQNKWSYVRYGNIFFKIVAFLEFTSYRFWEKRCAKKADAIISINDYEKSIFEEWTNEKNVFLVYPYLSKNLTTELPDRVNNRSLIMVGSYGYKAKEMNLEWLIQSVIPKALSNRPDIYLQVIGRGASSSLRSLVNASEHCVFVGEVEELSTWYEKCLASIVPERLGGGFKLKILEAIRFKTPLIIHKEALKGSGFTEGLDCLSFETSEEFKHALDQLINRPKYLDQLVLNSIETVNKSFSESAARISISSMFAYLRLS